MNGGESEVWGEDWRESERNGSSKGCMCVYVAGEGRVRADLNLKRALSLRAILFCLSFFLSVLFPFFYCILG